MLSHDSNSMIGQLTWNWFKSIFKLIGQQQTRAENEAPLHQLDKESH